MKNNEDQNYVSIILCNAHRDIHRAFSLIRIREPVFV